MSCYTYKFKTLIIHKDDHIDTRLNNFIRNRSDYRSFEIISHTAVSDGDSILFTIYYKFYSESRRGYDEELENSVE